MTLSRLVGSVLVGLTLLACSATNDFGSPKSSGGDDDETPKKGKLDDCSGGAASGEDPTSLPSCTGTKGTKGRCVSTSTNPDAKAFEKADCKAGQACVPDVIVKAGGIPELPKCKAVLGLEGRCFSPLANDVIASYDLLQGPTGSQCSGGDVCVPCKDPQTDKDTGICTPTAGSGGAQCSGGNDDGSQTSSPSPAAKCPYDGPPIDTSSFTQDSCPSGLLCVPKSSVPADVAAQLATCSKGLCAPKKSVAAAGMFLPKTCRSVANAEGRCLAAGLPAVAAQASSLPKADCDADERCVPCFDPSSGKATGACSTVPCDKPAEAAKSFPKCCGGKGSCVPVSLVPKGDQDNFADDGCKEDAELCLPTELAANDLGGAAPCQFNGLSAFGVKIADPYKGACIADCFDTFPDPPQANCAGGKVCIPCSELPAGTTACGK